MEAQLEINSYCVQNPSRVNINDQGNGDNRPSSNNGNNMQWFGSTFQSIITKLRELTKPEKTSLKSSTIEDWEIPFERIRLNQNEFQRGGSQGDVFYGRISNTPVAVKRVKDVALTRIKHLRDLNHKNIIKFRGISQNSNYHYIIMEWCQYGTIQDHIHNGRQLSSTILSNFAQQIASGMKYLHSKNIIHRDLKPSNILLTHNDVLKISDFGTHKVFEDKQPVTSISYAGTQAYMAPEVIRGEPYSFPVDVWSYGVVLWEIIIGDEPYKDLESSAVVWAVGNNSFHLPIPVSFPEGFLRILEGCWRAQPSERYTFQQICIILKGAIHEVEKISKERWLPLQAGWKRDARERLENQLQPKTDPSDCHVCKQKHQALDEKNERLQKRIDKNNDIYLQLQECCMHLQREREDVVRQEENIAIRQQLLERREEDLSKLEHEFNHYKEKLALICEELSRRNIKLDCLKQNNVSNERDESIIDTNL